MTALALLTAACTGSGSGGGHGTHASPAAAARPTATASATPSAPRVVITPGNGAAGVDPAAGITVTATRGTLTNVTVHTAGDPVSGHLSQDGRAWHSQWALNVSQAYTVTATATAPGHGGTVTAIS